MGPVNPERPNEATAPAAGFAVADDRSGLRVEGLRRHYGSTVALDGVDLSLGRGVTGLLGPNGAGKTTLMKIITGFLHPSSGTARVGGFDVLTETEKVQELIGYLPENAPIYPELTVQSYLKMIAELRRIPEAEQRARIGEAVTRATPGLSS